MSDQLWLLKGFDLLTASRHPFGERDITESPMK